MKKNKQFVKITKQGFELHLKKENIKLMWSEIVKIKTYKVDLITIDEIYIDFETNEKIVSVGEDCKGWDKLINEMLLVFKNINKNWKEDVMLPPFERKETLLFSKK